jgi:hypothetical protein
MIRSSLAFAATLLCGTAICSQAFSADVVAPSMEQVLNSVVLTQQSDTARFQVGPRWSEQYGWAIDARGAMMLSEALAVGLVVTLGENDRELVFNTGLQLDDKTILVGTLVGHQQNMPVGDDREWVDQLEGGVSLRSDAGVGFIGGYEVNAYGTRSSTDSSLDTGSMLGAEANLLLHPIAGMTARLGAGYEKISWADGDPTEGWTANLNITQTVGDTLNLKLGIDLGQAEDRYTAGTELLIADTGSSNSRLGLEYSYIVDKDGGDDEQRLTAYWRVGIGEGSKAAASTAAGYAGEVSLTPEPGHNHDRILNAVMEKPDYLPANVVAGRLPLCSDLGITMSAYLGETNVLSFVSYNPISPGGNGNMVFSTPSEAVNDLLVASQFSIGNLLWTKGTPGNGIGKTGPTAAMGIYNTTHDTYVDGRYYRAVFEGAINCEEQVLAERYFG